jgi:hypothetical protein
MKGRGSAASHARHESQRLSCSRHSDEELTPHVVYLEDAEPNPQSGSCYSRGSVAQHGLRSNRSGREGVARASLSSRVRLCLAWLRALRRSSVLVCTKLASLPAPVGLPQRRFVDRADFEQELELVAQAVRIISGSSVAIVNGTPGVVCS